MTKPINLRFKVLRFIAITLGILSISFVPFFFAPGLENPEPIGTFLNQQFPADPPSSSPYRVAFPNITFNTPTTFSYLPVVDKFMVGQREGSLHWFDNNETTTQKNLLINLSDEVGEVWDGGLLGAAVHPEFGLNNNNYIYIWFTTEDSLGREYPDFPGNYNCFSEDYWGNFLKLVRFEINVNDISIVPNSRLDMMVLRMYGTTHRGGGMVFGNDGFLYLTTGDQTGASKAQEITSNLDGGVLRLDVDQDATKSHPPTRLMPDDAGEIDEVSGVGYWIPNDNPFVSATGDNFEEYYTIGHRNPFRLTKDQLTGELFIGEVGRSTHEEINVVVKGENYGWPVFEGYADGLNCVPMYDDMTQKGPLVAFPRSEMNAIIGGYVYRGTENPALYGKYLCADYGDGEEIYAVDPQTGSYEFISNFLPENVIGFGENPNGELYIMQFGNDTHLYQIVPSATNAVNVPQKLSETGAFSDLNSLTPTQGLIPYELIESFWSDGAEKKRWMAIPNDGTHDTPAEQIKFSENGVWEFPIGTVLVKHFEMPIDENNPSLTRRLETRFSVKANDGNFYFLTYKWNSAGTDADLLSFGLDEQININLAAGGTKTINWRYPSNSECISCHNNTSKGSLGPRTRYLNSDYTYPQTGATGNQLITLSHLGILDENIDASDVSSFLTYKALDDQNATLDEKARSYLDLNCAYCHQPGTGNRAQFDLRLQNTLQETILLTSGVNTSLGIEGEAIIVPGDASKSILYHRMNSTQPGIAMPPLAKGQIHDEAVSLINDWINQLDENSDNGLCQNSTNLALNKAASQSSTYGNGVAGIAVDGNTVGTSPWDADLQHTISGQSQPWWQVDLGSQNQIEQIIIYNRTDKLQNRLNNFHIFISANPYDVNASLQDLINDTSITDIFYEGEAGLQETFGVIADGRYVRIQLSGENESLHMAEVMVMGCDKQSNDLCQGVALPLIEVTGPFTTNDDIQTLIAN
ncbi:PQQ-dependent sugar dehydrogenase, partial [Croceitalea vernalis]